MSYDFSFDKKSVSFILGGCIAIGVLLFFAGFVLGWDRGAFEARAEFQRQSAPIVAQNLPSRPDAETAEKSAAPAAPETKVAAKPSVQDDASTKIAQAPAPVNPAAPQASEAKPSEPQALPSKPTASAAPSAADDPDPAADAAGFSLQVGAFQNETNALRCQNSLKSRGYSVFLFHTFDADGHTWHTVRLGRYSDINKASQAAVAFTVKEKIPVFIRPVNEL